MKSSMDLNNLLRGFVSGFLVFNLILPAVFDMSFVVVKELVSGLVSINDGLGRKEEERASISEFFCFTELLLFYKQMRHDQRCIRVSGILLSLHNYRQRRTYIIIQLDINSILQSTNIYVA